MFWAEMLQLFVVAERRDRGGRYDIPGGIAMLEALPLETDTDTLTTARTATITLARRHRLSIFDATYLELAIRRALPLATFDAALQRAAAAEHLTLLT